MALSGLHGQALSWVPFLPSEGYTALLELMPMRMFTQGTHAFYDWPRWARMSAVRYFRVVLPDTDRCRGRDFRMCGDVVADASLVRSLELVVEETEPRCQVSGMRGWGCSRNQTDEQAGEQSQLSNPSRLKKLAHSARAQSLSPIRDDDARSNCKL